MCGEAEEAHKGMSHNHGYVDQVDYYMTDTTTKNRDIYLNQLERNLRFARERLSFHRATMDEEGMVLWSKVIAATEQCINDVRLA